MWRTKQRSIPVIKVGCYKGLNQYGSFIGGWARASDVGKVKVCTFPADSGCHPDDAQTLNLRGGTDLDAIRL